MSILPYILPVLTFVSLFLYIFSAERAWLPKKGTTEWITRASSKKYLSADIKIRFSWKDIIICAAITAVYGGILILTGLTKLTSIIVPIVCTAIFTGAVYLISYLLFDNRITALFASIITAADMFLLMTFTSDYMLLLLLAAFVLTTLMAVYNLVALVFAGIYLSLAAFVDPSCALFSLLALCPAIVTSVRTKNLRPVYMYLLLCVLLPAVIYIGMNFGIYGNISFVMALRTPEFFNIRYCLCMAVCFIFAVIHVFKDKSFPALFAAVGLIFSAIGMFFGNNFVPLFSGITAAVLADIIIKRGKASHKVSCIIFGTVMLIPVLYCTIYPFISTYII